jgi:anti-sigma factor RsiW
METKMRCLKIPKQISTYIDDQMNSDEKKVFSGHLQNCPDCQEALQEAQALHELLTSAEHFSAPYGFTTRVMANLTAEDSSPWWAVFTRRPLVLRAMEWGLALIIVLTGMVFGNLLMTDRADPNRAATLQEYFSLDLFQATPPDSVGGVYVALAEAPHEK